MLTDTLPWKRILLDLSSSSELFVLDDPEVYREVRARLADGMMIVGDYFPKSREVIIQFPKESDDYVEKRIKEVFGR